MRKNNVKNIIIILVCIFLMIALYSFPSFIIDSDPLKTFENLKIYIIVIMILGIALPIITRLFQSNKTKNIGNFKNNIQSLQTTNEFEILYNKLFTKDISELERKRKRLKILFILQNIVAVIFIIIYIGLAVNPYNFIKYNITKDDLNIIGYVLVFIYVTIMFFNTKKLSKYSMEFKNTIIQNFLKSLNPNLTFSSEVPSEVGIFNVYKNSTFDQEMFNSFEVDDYILDINNNIQMCDITTKMKRGSGKNKYVETIFQGMFSFSTLNKSFNNTIKISKNEMKLLQDSEYINLDNTEFEKYFDVYCEDRVLATRLLTSDVMQMIVEFYNRFKLHFEVIIKEDKLYLRFFTGPMFEPKIFGKIIDKKSLFVYYNVILFITELSNTINDELKNIDI